MQKNVEEYIKQRANNLAESWSERIFEEIERHNLTPIESLFYIEWEEQMASRYDEIPLYYYDNKRMPFLYPQWKIEIKKGKEKKKYRVDFLIKTSNLRDWDEPEKKEHMVIIEIDSHLWHGTTPEQFTKEKERERDLISAGYKILRFSGREIYRDAFRCVETVVAYCSKIK